LFSREKLGINVKAKKTKQNKTIFFPLAHAWLAPSSGGATPSWSAPKHRAAAEKQNKQKIRLVSAIG
jgi:hypothetical protein